MNKKVISKTLSLADLGCSEEVFANLEKLHYEVSAKERILAVALSIENTNVSGSFNDYYNSYFASFKEYEEAKNNMYNNYISKHVTENVHTMWEAHFPTRTVVLYEQ